MREYETIYVLKPDVPDEAAISFITKMKGLVEREGGKHLKITNWGRRKLAWERAKQQKGMFVHHRYLGAPGIVSEYERTLAIEETVLLRQTVLLGRSVDPSTKNPEEDILNPPAVKERKEDSRERRYGDDDDGDRYGDRGDRYGDRDRDRGDMDDDMEPRGRGRDRDVDNDVE
jgi:small subunit ribosomal protein S6